MSFFKCLFTLPGHFQEKNPLKLTYLPGAVDTSITTSGFTFYKLVMLFLWYHLSGKVFYEVRTGVSRTSLKPVSGHTYRKALGGLSEGQLTCLVRENSTTELLG
jgi:hypothetical protein